MKTSIKANRSVAVACVAATLAIAAMGFAGAAQARDNVSFSVGIGVPGVVIGATNAYPVYPQPVYVQPAPVYYEPVPVYYQQPVYLAPQPVFYGRPHGWKKHHGGGYYGPGYAPVYYRGGERGEHHGRGHDRDDD